MGRNLKAAGVVASVQSFIDAAGANRDSNEIQTGFFPLRKEMASETSSRSSSTRATS